MTLNLAANDLRCWSSLTADDEHLFRVNKCQKGDTRVHHGNWIECARVGYVVSPLLKCIIVALQAGIQAIRSRNVDPLVGFRFDQASIYSGRFGLRLGFQLVVEYVETVNA